jgi:hypothetical protein
VTHVTDIGGATHARYFHDTANCDMMGLDNINGAAPLTRPAPGAKELRSVAQQDSRQPAEASTVTDARDESAGACATETDIRDCRQCGKPIGPDEPVCIFERDSNEAQTFTPVCEDCTATIVRRHDRRQFVWWTSNGEEAPEFVRNPEDAAYEPLDSKRWQLRSCLRPFDAGSQGAGVLERVQVTATCD